MHDLACIAGILLGKVTYFYTACAAAVYPATISDAC